MQMILDNGSQNVVPKNVRIESDGHRTLLHIDGELVKGAICIAFRHEPNSFALEVKYALSPDLTA